MKIKIDVKLVVTIVLLGINGFIFLYRNNGFTYTQYYNDTASGCDESCIRKWVKPNLNFAETDLKKAYRLLQQNINIDSIASDENKLIAIGAWLQDELSRQTGIKNDSVNTLPALQQYYCFKKNSNFSFDCGNFQAMFSLFCTSVKLPCRNFQNIELPGNNPPRGSHVANEIYLKAYNKWVLADPYRNYLLIRKKKVPLSAAEYLDYNIAGVGDTLSVIKQSGGKVIKDIINPVRFSPDFYFNKNFILHIYKETDLQQIYSIQEKIKRYLLPVSWYEVYAPQQKNSNLLFHVKQLFLLAFAGWILFLIFRITRKSTT